MKKIYILFTLIALLTLSACVDKKENNNNKPTQNIQTEQKAKDNTAGNTVTTKENKQETTTKTLTFEEVKKHSTTSDCWTVIDNKVYDVSSFFGMHPGGDSNLEQICGKDGSKLFQFKHGDNIKAQNKLKSFYIGDLK